MKLERRKMYYLIENKRRTGKGKKVYYAPDESGYTSNISEAGFYSEEQVKEITSRVDDKGASPIPLTENRLARARREIKEMSQLREKRVAEEYERHKEILEMLEKRKYEEEKLRERLLCVEAEYKKGE